MCYKLKDKCVFCYYTFINNISNKYLEIKIWVIYSNQITKKVK